MSDVLRIAVPVESGEGLAAMRSGHFGHAAGFAIVEVADGEARDVRIIVNPPHEHGGCGLTVNLLAGEGVTTVVAGGMGPGPLNGLMAAGIDVHHEIEAPTVGGAVVALLEGRTQRFGGDHVCRGH